MQILTPPEQREVEKLKADVARLLPPRSGIDLPATVTLEIPYEKREMWLNVLGIVLQTNEALRQEWRSTEGLLHLNGGGEDG